MTLSLASGQTLRFPPLKKCRLDNFLKIRVGKALWTVDCYRCDNADVERYEAEDFAVVRRNGAEKGRWAPLERPFCHAFLVKIKPGYPVFAVRGAYGLGVHWDTMLFGIRKDKLIQMGRPPAMNSNGPILWHGNPKVWAFDNYDRYEKMHGSKYRAARILMRIGKDGKLHKWKTTYMAAPNIPETIPDDLDQ